MKNAFLSMFATVALVASASASDSWTMDLPAALAQAAKDNKAVMVDFNGSDWCGPCMMLKSKVFDTPEFAAYAKDKLILVDIDMPNGDKISPAQKEINKTLVEKYDIQAYPTVLVLNKDGVVLGGFIGGSDKLDKVKADIDAALANGAAVDAAMAKAAVLNGAEKAAALMEAYKLVPERIQEQNAALKAQIIANDADDVYGFAMLAKAKAEIVKINEQLMACESLEAIAKVKEALKAHATTYPKQKEMSESFLHGIEKMGDQGVLDYLNQMRGMQAKQK